jgi:hypothetical protein
MRLAVLAALMAGLKEKRKLRRPATPLGPLTSFFHAISRQLFHLAHLSQVDCQFGGCPNPFQSNDLHFISGLFRPTWLTLRTVSGPKK